MIHTDAKAAAAITRIVAALFFIVGIVLSPLRAVAATIPTLVAYDAAIRSTAMTWIETRPSLRPERNSCPEYTYDDVLEANGSPATPPVGRCAGAVHAYDASLEHPRWREVNAEGAIYGAATNTLAAEGADFAAHAAMRADLGLPAMGAEGSGALARLEAGGHEFWGINAHGQSVAPLSVNAISATHAEADAFAQAARAGVNGGTGRLIVDRALCPACGTFGAVRSMARQLGLESLEVVTPAGTSTLIP